MFLLCVAGSPTFFLIDIGHHAMGRLLVLEAGGPGIKFSGSGGVHGITPEDSGRLVGHHFFSQEIAVLCAQLLRIGLLKQ